MRKIKNNKKIYQDKLFLLSRNRNREQQSLNLESLFVITRNKNLKQHFILKLN